MSMEQDTLIYVEENDKKEAELLTKGLLNDAVRNRAYFNALGAELGLKYLALENISNAKTYNLHNVHKILEEFDMSDIMLTNIHIDVRVVFDENQIFIPKSHFEYDILPDIYFVFLLAKDCSHVKFLGFFEPKLINKNNENKDYYFIEKEKLTSPQNLKEYISSFKGNRTQTLSAEINDAAETLMVSLVDQNASKEEIKELLQYLSKSSELRDRFIEFENFEILSYKAERSPDVTVPEEISRENIIDATIDDLQAPVEDEQAQVSAEAVEEENPPQGEQGLETAVDEGVAAGGDNADPQLGPEAESETSATVEADVEAAESATEAMSEDNQAAAVDELSNVDLGVDNLSIEELPGLDMSGGELLGESALSGDIPSISEAPAELNSSEKEKNSASLAADIAAGAAAAAGGAVAEGVAAAETTAEIAVDTSQDVTEMFTNTPMSQLQETLESQNLETKPSENDTSAEVSVEKSPQTEGVSAQNAATVETPEDVSGQPAGEEASHDFVEGNMDDFFSDMNFDDASSETPQEPSPMDSLKQSLDLLNSAGDESSETTGFGSVDEAPQAEPEYASGDDEMEVLDISNVNAVPNNLDRNISETVEFNNIELSHETPCFNEVNGEETVPMLNMNDFTPLEPLPADNFSTESYDMDNLSITDNMTMPKMESKPEAAAVDSGKAAPAAENAPKTLQSLEPLEPLETVDMESLSINTGMAQAAQKQQQRSQEEEEALNALSSELDSIPDFGEEGLSGDDGGDLGANDNAPMAEEQSDTIDNPAEPIQAAAADTQGQISDEIPPLEDIANLTVADIVEQPAENGVPQEPVTDMDSLVPVDELANAEEQSQEIPTIVDAIENPELIEPQEDAAVQDENIHVNADESKTPEEAQGQQNEESGKNSDLNVLYSEDDSENMEASDDETIQQEEDIDLSGLDEIENFDAGMEQIPSIYKNNQKLPVKMIAVAAFTAVLIVAGFGVFSMKGKNSVTEPEPLAQALPEALPSNDAEANGTSSAGAETPDDIAQTPDVSGEQLPLADNADVLSDNTPEVQTIPAPQKEPVNVKKDDAGNAKKADAAAKPAPTPVSYTGVNKLSWEVPDYLSYSENIKKYLQTAGKSIKLTLSSDLLLVDEYAYSNQMKIDLKLSNEGNLKASNIVKSSGSNQIDKIVLQTVKDTLNVIKPATGEVPTPDFRLALIINF